MRLHAAVAPALLYLASLPCVADVVLDVHALGVKAAREARTPSPVAATHFTVVSLAMFDAANAVQGRYRPYRTQAAAPATADADAAALGAGCASLAASLPSQAAAIATACDDLAKSLPASEAVRAGRAYGEAVGKAAVAARQAEVKAVANTYRPRTTPGTYVSTALPVGFDFAAATPFALTSPSQFRPAPPPKLDSDVWVRDYNEVKTIGARNSTVRTPEQAATVMFWASNGPQQFVDSVPALPLRGATSDRARLLALYYMAMSDAGIAVFDAKYAYDFWRPVTAIRNGDEDGSAATERDAGWVPLIETPPHQEYPCAHCAVTAATMTVIASEASGQPIVVRPADASATAKPRSFASAGDAMSEVANARVWGGIHYRNSTDAGLALGRSVAKQVLDTRLQPLN